MRETATVARHPRNQELRIRQRWEILGPCHPYSLLLLRGFVLGDRLWRVLRSPPCLHELGKALSTSRGQGSLFRSAFRRGCFLYRLLLGPAPSLTLTPPIRG